MVNIIPFNGYRFNSKKIDDLGKVMAPPYDAISNSAREELYQYDEYNIVRLNKGIQYPDDNETANCFTRATELLSSWIEKEVLVREAEPSFYLYQQTVTYKHTVYTNLGVIGLMELQDLNSGNIMQCEKMHPHNKLAHELLLNNTNSNFSLINCIYMEYEKAMMNKLTEISEKQVPDMEFKTHETIIGEDVNQKLWVICDPETIVFIKDILENQTFYIADGQTRYEVSLEYKKQCEKNNPHHTGKEPYNYIMTLFTNAFDDGLIQLPVHRLLKFERRFSEDFFISCAQDYFKIEKIIVDKSIEEFPYTMKKQIATNRNENKFALYCGGDYFYRLTLKDTKRLQELLPDVSDAYRRLDVTVLNYIILKELLNFDEDKMKTCIDYTTRSSIGIEKVKAGEYGCMLVVNPVRAEHICGVARAHERMPERSMFIFPKSSTGVVIYRMENE